MENATALAHLEQALNALAQRLTPLADHQTLCPRFDRQLFRCSSPRLSDYLNETQITFSELRAACRVGDIVKAGWLAQKLTDQMSALTKEADSWALRRYDGGRRGLDKLHADVLRHQEYERRLTAMIAGREQLLNTQETLAEQQRLAAELAQYRQRLVRCQRALSALQLRLSQACR